MAGLALAAYAAGRWTAAATPTRLAHLERRLVQLEDEREDRSWEPSDAKTGANLVGKEYTAFHYETLANQAVQERRMDELDMRLLGVELRGRDSRAQRCADRQHATTGESRHG